jgi:hypothetical protein
MDRMLGNVTSTQAMMLRLAQLQDEGVCETSRDNQFRRHLGGGPRNIAASRKSRTRCPRRVLSEIEEYNAHNA